MPLFYQHNINDMASFAVWHITEPESFFLKKVHVQKEINHPQKRLQHLAGRYLLQILYPAFPLHLIEIAESNKPSLKDESFHFSISHCSNYAAAIISENCSAGIDIELITPKIELIKNKFLSEEELRLAGTVSINILTVLWSCKEAVYKWYGKGGIDFKKDIVVKKMFVQNIEGFITCLFTKELKKEINVHFRFFESICLAWIVH